MILSRATALLVVWLAWALAPRAAQAEERSGPTPVPEATPPPEPVVRETPPPGFRRVTGEPTATPTPTPLVRPKLVAALESREGPDTERVAFFDDGTLVLVRTYKRRPVLRRKELSGSEVDLYRKVCAEALLVPATWAVRERAFSDVAKVIRVEVARPEGGSRIFETDDLTQLPLAVGRAKAALEDLRSRFYQTDTKETNWDPKGVREGDYLRHRSDGSWYVVVRDDSFEPSLEVEEAGGLRNRMLLLREQLPKLFENPADAGPPPIPTPER
ncbi:MAG: hypothetical protein ACM3JH_04990 [Acidithiobacillales bacterium]